jgi:hypothetical protein
MAAVLLLLVMMASPATTTTVTPNTANAMPTNIPSGDEIIRAAQTRHNRIFGAYVLILVLTVIGTYLVWSSGNEVQDAVQAEANARIEEAKAVAAQANQRAEEERLARVKIEERLAGRRISPEKHDELVAILKQTPGSIVISGLANVDESKTYAIAIAGIFRDAGWQTVFALVPPGPNPPVGVVCKADASKIAGRALKTALTRLPGATVIPAQYNESPPDQAGVIIVGLRTPPSN